jgi:hypothetical protein
MRKNIRLHSLLVALIALVVCSEPLRAQTANSPPPNPFLDAQNGVTES